jgi:hypothetical protein
MSEALQTQGYWLHRTVFERLDRITLASHSTRQPQRAVDQPAPTVLFAPFREHAIERERRGNQPPHGPRHVLLSDLDAAVVSARERFEDRQLRPREVGDAVLKATERE